MHRFVHCATLRGVQLSVKGIYKKTQGQNTGIKTQGNTGIKTQGQNTGKHRDQNTGTKHRDQNTGKHRD